MKLATFETEGRTRIGVVDGDAVVDVSAALAGEAGTDWTDMTAFLAAGDGALARAREAVARSRAGEAARARVPLTSVRLRAPVPRPPKIMMGGRNYAAHIGELQSFDASIPRPPFPRIFSKYATSVVGPGDTVVWPKIVEQVDFEGELTVVIGKGGRNIPEAEAYDHVAGYTIINDVTARDIQAKQELILSKNFETFCPVGPWIVTRDEIPDPLALTVRTYINDRKIAENRTSDMIFNVVQYVSFLSEAFPLEPGDLISTGSPPGPGMYHDPPILPQAGDVMRIEIDRVGVLANPLSARRAR